MGRLGIRKLVLLAVGLFAAVATSPAHAAFSSAPDRTYVTNGSVRAIVRSGGTVYLGGDFTRIAPRTGAGAELNLASKPEFNSALQPPTLVGRVMHAFDFGHSTETEQERVLRAYFDRLDVYSPKESRFIGIRFTSADHRRLT